MWRGSRSGRGLLDDEEAASRGTVLDDQGDVITDFGWPKGAACQMTAGGNGGLGLIMQYSGGNAAHDEWAGGWTVKVESLLRMTE